jgi:hypothetical protein
VVYFGTRINWNREFGHHARSATLRISFAGPHYPMCGAYVSRWEHVAFFLSASKSVNMIQRSMENKLLFPESKKIWTISGFIKMLLGRNVYNSVPQISHTRHRYISFCINVISAHRLAPASRRQLSTIRGLNTSICRVEIGKTALELLINSQKNFWSIFVKGWMRQLKDFP